MDNQYTRITEYYDLWITSGYYNFKSLAEEAYSIVGQGRNIIELGVGTGLLVEEYLKVDPTCQFTGVDFTASMLDIAKKRLGDRCQLVEADVVTMDLDAKFEVAISNGGVWVSYDLGDNPWEVGSLIPKFESNLPGLINVARHLEEGGLFLLNVQQPHETFDKLLSSGIVYAQAVEEVEDTVDYRIIHKTYYFKKDEEILAQDRHQITYLKQDAYQRMFDKAGFEFQQVSTGKSDRFAVYKKR